jgi:molybdopterin converting factor small subunit
LKVEVRLFANLAKLLPPGSQNKRATLNIKKGTNVAELLEELKIPERVTNVIMINGVYKDKETELNEGDVISVFPPISGG